MYSERKLNLAINGIIKHLSLVESTFENNARELVKLALNNYVKISAPKTNEFVIIRLLKRIKILIICLKCN